jgi:CheY-like chemotaxis protein
MGGLGLVIDDDAASRMIYASLLKSMGFDTVEAGDGVQAMAILETMQPALIFLDIRLPKIDGTQILEYVYRHDRFQATRVVVITAHKDFEARLGLRQGDLYLVKPIAPSDIREMIR